MNRSEIGERIDRIWDGVPFQLGNMTISTNSGKLLVTGRTNTIHFENISKQSILRELDELKASFLDLSKSFHDLNYFVKANDLIIEYHMAYDDMGKASVGICTEIEGKLDWYIQ